MKTNLLLFFALLTTLLSAQNTAPCYTDSLMLKTYSAGDWALHAETIKKMLEWRDAHEGDFNRYAKPGGFHGLNPSGCEQNTFYIPVVVHIIHLAQDSLAGMGSNISDAQVQSALDAVNKYFRNYNGFGAPAVNTGIQFCLATCKPDGSSFTGIFRFDSVQSNHIIDSIGRLSNISSLPASNYLNIYVVNKILNADSIDNGVLVFENGKFSTEKVVHSK
jgi:hypothetical protein